MTPAEQIRAGLLQQTRHKGDAADKALALLETPIDTAVKMLIDEGLDVQIVIGEQS